MKNSYILHNIYDKYMIFNVLHVCSGVCSRSIVSTLLHIIRSVYQIFAQFGSPKNNEKKFLRVAPAPILDGRGVPPAPL